MLRDRGGVLPLKWEMNAGGKRGGAGLGSCADLE